MGALLTDQLDGFHTVIRVDDCIERVAQYILWFSFIRVAFTSHRSAILRCMLVRDPENSGFGVRIVMFAMGIVTVHWGRRSAMHGVGLLRQIL